MTRILFFVALAACSRKSDERAATATVAAMPAPEIQRGKDACAAYVQKVCACADSIKDNNAIGDLCKVSHAMPDAIDTALRSAQAPDTDPHDANRLYDSVRKMVKSCVEQTAKLPTMGCPL